MAVFAIFWTIKNKKNISGNNTLGMVIGIILTLFFSKSGNYFELYIYMGFVSLSSLYGILVGILKLWDRIIISLMSGSIFLYWLWVLNHWHGNTLLFPILTILIGLTEIIRKVKLKNEFGFLIILFMDAILILLEVIM